MVYVCFALPYYQAKNFALGSGPNNLEAAMASDLFCGVKLYDFA